MDKNKKILLISAIIVLILIVTVILIVTLSNPKEDLVAKDDKYNQEVYVDVALPDILGDDNVQIDEFGKKTNMSELLKVDKTWMDLVFSDFNVYSLRAGISTIEFDITNPTTYLYESGKFQLQLLGENSEVLSVIDFDEVRMLTGAVYHVIVSITGDITNLKDIKIDDINYTMKVEGGNNEK